MFNMIAFLMQSTCDRREYRVCPALTEGMRNSASFSGSSSQGLQRQPERSGQRDSM